MRQGSRTVDDYTIEFHQLVSQNDLAETKEQLVSRYIEGLHPQIQDTLNLFDMHINGLYNWRNNPIADLVLATRTLQTRQ